MAGNGGGGDGAGSSRGGGGGGHGASITAAAAAVGSAEARFPLQERQSRWEGCFGGFSCFGSHKRGKRIVPSSRTPDGNGSRNHGNGPQAAALSNQTTTLTLSLLAPPSSPASFTNSALPSTAQSPSCFLSISANSPGGPSSTMFATGPYAHETQLVSPPVFSTFTTEPSTAPLTPPPELAHLTTPSSPDVPYARFLSSSLDLKTAGKENGVSYVSTGYGASSDLQATYPLYPGSPSSSLISPASVTPRTGLSSPFPEHEVPTKCGASLSAHESPYSRSRPSKLFGLNNYTNKNFMLSPDSSLFCSASSAQFYLDQAQQPFPSYSNCGGRLSVSREADVYSSVGHRHSKACKQDVEEIEAYRASFGFSADELISTQNYVEIPDVADDSFTMAPFVNAQNLYVDSCQRTGMNGSGESTETVKVDSLDCNGPGSSSGHANHRDPCNASAGFKLRSQNADNSMVNSHNVTGDKLVPKMWGMKTRSFRLATSASDAEIDYRRSRSSRETHSIVTWHS
uniref:Uncharacterized protein At1g76660 n=2 Tax=Anthurium amnicola TaxID=1678845 RepID=A0A1D1YVB4_9ARAE